MMESQTVEVDEVKEVDENNEEIDYSDEPTTTTKTSKAKGDISINFEAGTDSFPKWQTGLINSGAETEATLAEKTADELAALKDEVLATQ